VPKPLRGLDAFAQRHARVVGAPERFERRREPPVAVALVVVAREVRLEVRSGLVPQAFFERLIRETIVRQKIRGIFRDHLPKDVDTSAHRSKS
jgi:hypothetical protein